MQFRLQSIQQRLAQACAQNGRDPNSVRLLPVSKTFAHEQVQQAMALGLNRFGENRTQDIRDRFEYFATQPAQPQWVMIGHTQSNKAKEVARYAAELQSLDRMSLAQALQRRLEMEERLLPVYVQVKTAAEDSKSGLNPQELLSFLKNIQSLDTLQPVGLMTMATQTEDEQEIRRCFAQLRELRDAAQQAGFDYIERLSMGMSNDFELAIAEGSTDVRIGSLLFGDRSG